MEITLDLKWLRDWQKQFIQNDKRYSVLVIHRRAWKTTISITKLIYEALKNKGFYWYISPTYRQSKAIAWEMLKKFTRQIPWTETNESELYVRFPNWSLIRLFWADNPDSLRWLDLKWVVFDEYAQQPANIYSEIIFPMLNANNWFAIWIWTPKGKNAFHTLYEKWRKDDKYFTMLLGVSYTKLLNEQQLKDARAEMTQEEYDQEYECSFTASIKWAYYKNELEKCRLEWRIKAWLYDPLLPVYTFWDLWISDYMAITFVQVYWNQIRVIDSYCENGKWFEHYYRVLNEKWYVYEMHYFPHDIEVRELTTWQSRLEIVRELFKWKVSVLPRMKVIDWINAVRRVFHNIWFDEKCEDLVNALSLYRQKYDEKRDLFLETPEHDWTSHYADSFRYMWIWYNQLLSLVNTDYEEVFEVDYSQYL